MSLHYARFFLLLGLALQVGRAEAQPFFDAPWRAFQTGSDPEAHYAYALLSADLNGDGVADAVTAQNVYSPGLRVLLGGRETAGEPAAFESEGALYPLTNGAVEVVAADLDGDGDLDLAAPDIDPFLSSGTALAVFFNSGDGTFGPAQYLPAGGVSTDVAAADVDGDGDVDLAVANYGAGGSGATVSILRNVGSGTFGAPEPYASAAAPRVIEAGDLDGDGDVDLAVSHNYTQMSVHLNAGDGTFAQTRVYADVYPVPRQAEVVLLDPDGDGDLDLLHPGYYDNSAVEEGRLVLLRNDGTANFTVERIPYGLPFRNVAETLVAVDLDGDGRDDVVGAQPYEPGYVVFRDDDAGGFLPGELYAGVQLSSAHAATIGVATPDLDGDGDPDVLTAGRIPRLLSTHENLGDGTFPERPIYGRGDAHAVLDLGDVDGDGDLDAATSHAGRYRSDVAVYRNDGSGAFAESYRTPGDRLSPLYGYAKLRDLTGDGVLDLLWVTAPSPPPGMPYDFFTARGNGDGTFGAVVQWPANSCGFAHPAAFDIDGDGDLDVINTEDRGCPSVPIGQLYVSRNNGNGTFQPPYIVSTLGFPYNLTAGDFNEDGKLDLVTTGSRSALLLGNGNGTFQPPQELPFGAFVSANVLALDLDADGHLDLAGLDLDYDESFLNVLLGNGAGAFTEAEHRDYPTQDHREWVAAGDVDADGDPDLMVGGVQDALIFSNDGAGAFAFSGRYGIGTGAHSLHYADATGDGRGDLLALVSHEMPMSGGHTGVAVVRGLTGLVVASDPVAPGSPASGGLALSAPRPNPTGGAVAFTLAVGHSQALRVEAFDALGRRVAVLHDGVLTAGAHPLAMDAAALAPGLYVVRAVGASGSVARRVVVGR